MTLYKIWSKFVGLFPSALPQGAQEFDSWADSIASTYKLPTNDSDSIKFTLSTIIMHLGPQTAYKAKYYFVTVLRAAAAKQVAAAKFYEIKTKQAEKAKAIDGQTAAAPALAVVPSGSQQ